MTIRRVNHYPMWVHPTDEKVEDEYTHKYASEVSITRRADKEL